MRILLTAVALLMAMAVHAATTASGPGVNPAPITSTTTIPVVMMSTGAMNVVQISGVSFPVGPDGIPYIPVRNFEDAKNQEEIIVLLREISTRLLFLMEGAGRGYGQATPQDGKENK